MKKYIFILVMFFAVQGMAQNDLIELWNEKYIPYCDSLVYDTVTETGTVKYDIVEKGGDIKLIPKDTVWRCVECDEYYNMNYLSGLSFNRLSLGHGNYTIGTTSEGMLIATPYSMIKSNEFTTEIKREKICAMKFKQPYFADFWDWLRDNKYVK